MIAISLAATASVVSVKAETRQTEQLAQFPGINLPGVGGSDKPAESQPASQEFNGFSSNYTDYSDTYNGFKIKVPAEFKLNNRGATIDWSTTTAIDGGVATIYINSAPLKRVASKVVYETNLKSKKEDRNYTEVVPVKVRYGHKTAYAFHCKEASHKPGSPEEKEANDIHCWHLFVFDQSDGLHNGFYRNLCGFQGQQVAAHF